MTFQEFKNTYEHKEVIELKRNNFRPLVSICITTFNHKNFIKNCLESIVEQKTNFKYEILIGDDASTDGTQEICQEFAEKFSNKIRLFLHHRENNIAVNGKPTGRFNFFYNLYQAQGKYVAWCDGDDYWTDPYKLQKQVDFLEIHQDHGLHCGAYVKNNLITKEISEIRQTQFLKPDEEGFSFGLNEFKKTWIPKSLTVMFKRDLLNFDDLFQFKYFRDIHLFYSVLNKSKGYYLNELLANYNMLGTGVHTSMLGIKNLEYSYIIYKEMYDKTKSEFSRFSLFRAQINLFFTYLYSGKFSKISGNSILAIVKIFNFKKDFKTLLKAAVPPMVK